MSRSNGARLHRDAPQRGSGPEAERRLVTNRRLGASLLLAVVVAVLAWSSGSPIGATVVNRPAAVKAASITGPGVTATEIKIGQIVTASGPVPGLFEGAAQGLDAYVAYVNAQGGVDGRKLVVVHEDDAYNCANYTNELKTLTKSVFAVVGTFTLEDACGSSVLKADPTFPDLQAYILNPQILSIPNVFAASVQPPGFPTTGYQWVKNKYPSAIKHMGSLYLTTALPEFKEQSAAAESIGYKLIYQQGISYTDTNFTADILRMKAAGVQVVDLSAQGPVSAGATFMQEAQQQGFHPVAVIDDNAYNSGFFSLLGGSAKTAANNLIMPNYFDMYLGDTSKAANPELAIFLSWLQKVHPGAAPSDYGVTAWAAGMLLASAVKAAGANVTQAGVIRATTNLGTFSANGLLPADNPGKRIGPHCMIIVGVKNGKFVRLDPTAAGFECDGTYHNIPLSALG